MERYFDQPIAKNVPHLDAMLKHSMFEILLFYNRRIQVKSKLIFLARVNHHPGGKIQASKLRVIWLAFFLLHYNFAGFDDYMRDYRLISRREKKVSGSDNENRSEKDARIQLVGLDVVMTSCCCCDDGYHQGGRGGWMDI